MYSTTMGTGATATGYNCTLLLGIQLKSLDDYKYLVQTLLHIVHNFVRKNISTVCNILNRVVSHNKHQIGHYYVDNLNDT